MSSALPALRAGLAAVLALLVMAATTRAAGSLTVTLASRRHSGVWATATLTAKDDMTIVTVRVFGDASVSYFPDIRPGTCDDAAAEPWAPLAPASPDAPSEAMLDVSVDRLVSGSYVIMLHPGDGTLSSLAPDAAVACGEIRRPSEASSVANAAPATGIPARASGRSTAPLALALLAAASGAAYAARRLSSRERSR